MIKKGCLCDLSCPYKLASARILKESTQLIYRCNNCKEYGTSELGQLLRLCEAYCHIQQFQDDTNPNFTVTDMTPEDPFYPFRQNRSPKVEPPEAGQSAPKGQQISVITRINLNSTDNQLDDKQSGQQSSVITRTNLLRPVKLKTPQVEPPEATQPQKSSNQTKTNPKSILRVGQPVASHLLAKKQKSAFETREDSTLLLNTLQASQHEAVGEDQQRSTLINSNIKLIKDVDLPEAGLSIDARPQDSANTRVHPIRPIQEASQSTAERPQNLTQTSTNHKSILLVKRTEIDESAKMAQQRSVLSMPNLNRVFHPDLPESTAKKPQRYGLKRTHPNSILQVDPPEACQSVETVQQSGAYTRANPNRPFQIKLPKTDESTPKTHERNIAKRTNLNRPNQVEQPKVEHITAPQTFDESRTNVSALMQVKRQVVDESGPLSPQSSSQKKTNPDRPFSLELQTAGQSEAKKPQRRNLKSILRVELPEADKTRPNNSDEPMRNVNTILQVKRPIAGQSAGSGIRGFAQKRRVYNTTMQLEITEEDEPGLSFTQKEAYLNKLFQVELPEADISAGNSKEGSSPTGTNYNKNVQVEQAETSQSSQQSSALTEENRNKIIQVDQPEAGQSTTADSEGIMQIEQPEAGISDDSSQQNSAPTGANHNTIMEVEQPEAEKFDDSSQQSFAPMEVNHNTIIQVEQPEAGQSATVDSEGTTAKINRCFLIQLPEPDQFTTGPEPFSSINSEVYSRVYNKLLPLIIGKNSTPDFEFQCPDTSQGRWLLSIVENILEEEGVYIQRGHEPGTEVEYCFQLLSNAELRVRGIAE